MEEIVQYGNANEFVNPQLHVWGFPIALYLFVGGLIAGILLVIAFNYLFNKTEARLSNQYSLAGLAFGLLVLGCIMLLVDLRQVTQFYKLFFHFDLEAPMSWGAWVLMLSFALLLLWWDPVDIPWYRKLIRGKKFRMILAVITIPVALLLGAYTGMLLNVMVARPLWNSVWLPALFLLSGLSAGLVVVNGWGEKGLKSKKTIKIDLGILVLELAVLTLFLFDLSKGTEVQVFAFNDLLGGNYSIAFWFLVILIGLLLPIIIEISELNNRKVSAKAAPVLVLLGSFCLRYLIVLAGQAIELPY